MSDCVVVGDPLAAARQLASDVGTDHVADADVRDLVSNVTSGRGAEVDFDSSANAGLQLELDLPTTGPSSLQYGDGQRPKPGHIRLLRGIELDNHRSEGRKHLITSQYSSCRQDVSGARPLS
jgi:hypothetical protein